MVPIRPNRMMKHFQSQGSDLTNLELHCANRPRHGWVDRYCRKAIGFENFFKFAR